MNLVSDAESSRVESGGSDRRGGRGREGGARRLRAVHEDRHGAPPHREHYFFKNRKNPTISVCISLLRVP